MFKIQESAAYVKNAGMESFKKGENLQFGEIRQEN
jgi:hypothetical protein